MCSATVPTKQAEESTDKEEAENLFAKRNRKIDQKPLAIDYVIDEFWAESFVVFAGAHGLGKSTIVVFLALIGCGAIRVDGLNVKIPRDILYVTEDVEQLQRLIHETVAQWNGDLSIVESRFHVFQACREDARTYLELRKWYEPMVRTIAHQVTGEPVRIEPVLILDTANATVSVDGDSNNSEIGKAINILRMLFKSVLLVTHVAKGTTRNDPELISARGATAWVADAQTEWVLFEDKGVPHARFLFSDSPKKRRDAGYIRELKFETTVRRKMALDSFGYEHELKTVVVMSATYSDKLAREDSARREQAKEANKVMTYHKDAIKLTLNKFQRARLADPDNIELYATKKIFDDLSATDHRLTRAQLRMALEELTEDGEVIESTLPEQHRRGGRQKYFELPSSPSK